MFYKFQHHSTQIFFQNGELTLVSPSYFCNTSNQGGCYNPLPRFSEQNPLWNWFWCQLVGMDLLYPYIPKWVQSAKALRSYDVIKICRTWKLRFSEENRRKFQKKNQHFAIKVLNIKISPRFWLIHKENGNSNMFCKFQHHSMQIFFKILKIVLKVKRSQQPPSPSDFDGLPYPRVRWYPHFFSWKWPQRM